VSDPTEQAAREFMGWVLPSHIEVKYYTSGVSIGMFITCPHHAFGPITENYLNPVQLDKRVGEFISGHDHFADLYPAPSPSVSVPTPTPTAANGKHETWAERVVAAAAGAMGSDVAVDLGEHRDVATAVLRELATQLDETLFKHVDSIAPALRILADEIERAGGV
jgi:hypothetical protein